MSDAIHPYPASDTVTAEQLAAARRGNEHEFSSLTEPYRYELKVHCYRILGSLHEAEDMVQETLLRAWKRLDTYQGRASFRAWLYKIATNACLDVLDRRRTRRLLPENARPVSDPTVPVAPPIAESVWLEPYPDEWLAKSTSNPEARYTAVESVSFAFLAALQGLPPRQRAVLILRDVLDWPAREAADLLDLTTSAVNSALHRARVTLAEHYHGEVPEHLDQSEADERTQQILERYVHAWEAADVVGLVALLKEDAAFSMPPSPSWYCGQESIRIFVGQTVFADQGMFSGKAIGRWRLEYTRANGHPAFALYQRTEDGTYQAFGLHVLHIMEGRIAEIISFIDPSLPPLFV